MDGIRLNDLESLEAYGVDKQKLVEEITRAYAHQIYIDGFFNGDPHPGTLSLSPSTFVLMYACAYDVTLPIVPCAHELFWLSYWNHHRKFSCEQGISTSSYFT